MVLCAATEVNNFFLRCLENLPSPFDHDCIDTDNWVFYKGQCHDNICAEKNMLPAKKKSARYSIDTTRRNVRCKKMACLCSPQPV